MSTVETVRLSREDFISWLAKALSGAPILSARGWRRPPKVDGRNARVGARGAGLLADRSASPQVQIKDLFAFVSTYTKARPFSAFFRVLPLELVSVLEPRMGCKSQRSALARCVAGAAMAETWVASAREADRPRNVFPLLLSSAFGHAWQSGARGLRRGGFRLGAAGVGRAPKSVR